jgi:hypothetical protein
MSRLICIAAVLAVALSGCGDDDADTPERAAVPSDAAAVAKRCGLGTPQPNEPRVVPDALLLPEAFVVGGGAVAYRGALNDVYRSLLAAAQRAGLEIEFKEVEVLDAELEIRDGDDVVRLALSPAPRCQDVTRASVTRGAA